MDWIWNCEKEEYIKIFEKLINEDSDEIIIKAQKEIESTILDSKKGMRHEYSDVDIKNIYATTQIILAVLRTEYRSGLVERMIANYVRSKERELEKRLANLSPSTFINKVSESLPFEVLREEGIYENVLVNLIDYLKYRSHISKELPSPVELEFVKKNSRVYVVITTKHLIKILKRIFFENYLRGLNMVEEIFRSRSEDEQNLIRMKIKRYSDSFIKKITENNIKFLDSEDFHFDGEMNPIYFPPCIKRILSDLQDGANLTHYARFYLTTFLSAIGMKNEDIFNLFQTSPDFNRERTTYQINHITGKISSKKYSPPKCNTLKINGLCVNQDDLCKKISHPLSYYVIKKAKHSKIPQS